MSTMAKDRRIKVHKRFVPFFQELKEANIIQDYQQLFMTAFVLGAKQRTENTDRGGLTAIIRAVIFGSGQLDLIRTVLYDRDSVIYEDEECLTKAESFVTTGLEILTTTVIHEFVFTAEDGTVHLLPGKEQEALLALMRYVHEDSVSVPF
ncbi:hypothetical protein [Alkalicoccobacillus porphyridii]|uniref:Uncharacterized protein n=1 Tax=Alkalicoccobacillus porphyridii TaxID=2597270 RepID=A0A554A1Y0_9BACI|nr:hypothetical protein [Alkalicoccobacillus porphyridii]TSB47697.1 hypothetical protein FN960_04045 [Alkalicoccobacillus porphyridii]